MLSDGQALGAVLTVVTPWGGSSQSSMTVFVLLSKCNRAFRAPVENDSQFRVPALASYSRWTVRVAENSFQQSKLCLRLALVVTTDANSEKCSERLGFAPRGERFADENFASV
jgi:hypothetical protein